MALVLTAVLTAKMSINASKANNNITPAAVATLQKELTLDSTAATGLNKADQFLSKVNAALAASGTEAMDVSGGTTNAFGETVTMARVKGILLVNNGTVAISLSTTIPGLFDAADNTLIVRPGGAALIEANDATGYVVTATSADTLTITNLSGSVAASYELYVVGVTT